MTDKARALKAAGRDVIGLGAGEPDFDTPENIKEAAIKAIESGKASKYTAVDGIAELKAAIARKFKRENGSTTSRARSSSAPVASRCCTTRSMATLNPGDEVIIPAPYWVSYPDMVLLAGASRCAVDAAIEDGFKVKPEQLERRSPRRPNGCIFNSPSNPTGAAYTRAELKAMTDVLVRHPHVG